MFPSTDPPSSEDALPPQADEPPCTEQGGRNSNPSAATNPHLDRWLEVVGGDSQLSSEAFMVATVLARSVALGRVAFTNLEESNSPPRFAPEWARSGPGLRISDGWACAWHQKFRIA